MLTLLTSILIQLNYHYNNTYATQIQQMHRLFALNTALAVLLLDLFEACFPHKIDSVRFYNLGLSIFSLISVNNFQLKKFRLKSFVAIELTIYVKIGITEFRA